MDCKFLTNGIALAYQDTIKPCCVWNFDEKFQKEHQLNLVNLATWHQHSDIQNAKSLLAQGVWPKNCNFCKQQESQGRNDSVRLNGLSSYSNYSQDDITLEIRPGSVCNFACQTCWPAASTRVKSYYDQAKITIVKKDLLTSVDVEEKNNFENFDFLNPIAHRLKSVVLLGGEPFYDKNCLNFLDWWNQNTHAELLMFTNGSNIKFDFLEKTNKKVTLVFSLDAVGKPAEYIRFGTDWDVVFENFNRCKDLKNIELRVNITQSVYNYVYLCDLLELLMPNWPNLVTFSIVFESYLNESVIPTKDRKNIILRLLQTIGRLEKAQIEVGQKQNAINSLKSIVNNLKNLDFNEENWTQFKTFVGKMDQVKGIDIKQYCPEVANYIY
jgi:organic radical activating enzyme